MIFRKTLNFKVHDANQSFSVLIFILPEESGSFRLYQDFFPVAWKVINFIHGFSEASIDYEMNLKAFVSMGLFGNLITEEASVEVSQGQSVSAVMDSFGVPTFNEPSGAITPGATIHIENKTGNSNVLGLMIGDAPAVVFPKVDNQKVVEIKVSPKIYLVVNQDYQQSEIIKSAVDSNSIVCIDLGSYSKDSIDINVGQDRDAAWKITAN